MKSLRDRVPSNPNPNPNITHHMKLCFSIVASFSGPHPKIRHTELVSVIDAWPLDKPTPSQPYDSDYSYLARESGEVPRAVLDVLDGSAEETRFRILEKLESKGYDIFWASVCDVQVSGILDRETMFKFLNDIDAQFEDVGTLGTLGGPLGIGIVPDFPFSVQSQEMIASIRITPVLCRKEGDQWDPVRPPNESQWERIEQVFRDCDVYRIHNRKAFTKESRNRDLVPS